MELIAIPVVAITLAVLLYLKERSERGELDEPKAEYADPWASLPPKWVPPRAESDLASERKAA